MWSLKNNTGEFIYKTETDRHRKQTYGANYNTVPIVDMCHDVKCRKNEFAYWKRSRVTRIKPFFSVEIQIGCHVLTRKMRRKRWPVMSIHGDMSQQECD